MQLTSQLLRMVILASLLFASLPGCQEKRVARGSKIKGVEASAVPQSTDDQTSGEAGPATGELELQDQALAILEQRCAACHNLGNPQGSFGTILDVDEMIKSGLYIQPGNAAASEIIKRLAPVGNMPPNGNIAAEEIEILTRWIDTMEVVPIEPLTNQQMLQLIRNDLTNQVQAADRPSTRYFTLQVANNAGMSAETKEAMVKAFAKVINSLSRANQIALPVAIDERELIYRVQLRDLLLDTVLFEAVINDFYPFGSNFISIPGDATTAAVAADHQFLASEIQTENYALRMDWFNATAALPVVYARLLELPPTLAELEASLGVNRLQEIGANQAMRAGFRNSGVSSQNRMIERLTSATTNLAYWISYDFADNNEGQQNLFNFPLGPVGIGFDAKAFDEDGGEVIFQLPNGMFGYYLSLADGSAIHKGPVNIVKQDDGPTQLFQSILNGMSCMSCHGQGLLFKKDEIRGFVEVSADFSVEERNKVLALYPQEADLKAAMDQDNQAYFTALESMGINVGDPDPVDYSYRFYNKNLFRGDLQAELRMSDEAFNALLQQEPFKSAWVSIYINSGSITRDEFNQLYDEALANFAADLEPRRPLQGDHLAKPSCMVADPALMDGCTRLENLPEEAAAPDPAAQ